MDNRPSLSVVLVDDDPHARRIFQLIMNHHQIQHAVMSNAKQAIEYLRTHTPNVVLVDLFLPDIDGYKLLDSIRQNALSPGCCVVATTAYYTNDTKQEVQQRGFDGYVPKPIEAQGLVAYLESLI